MTRPLARVSKASAAISRRINPRHRNKEIQDYELSWFRAPKRMQHVIGKLPSHANSGDITIGP